MDVREATSDRKKRKHKQYLHVPMSPTAMLTMRAEYEPGVPTWQPLRTTTKANEAV